MANWRDGSSGSRTPAQLDAAAGIALSGAVLPGLPSATLPVGTLFARSVSATDLSLWRVAAGGVAWELVLGPHASQHAPGGTDELTMYEKGNLRALLSDRAIIAETFPWLAAATNSGTALATGRTYGNLIGLLAGQTVSTLTFCAGVGGSGLTLVKVALFSLTGVLLGVSADASASMGSAGRKSVNLLAPYTPLAQGSAYASLLEVGTTGNAVRRGAGLASDGAAIGSGKPVSVSVGGQTDISGNVTFVQDTNYVAIYMAAS